MDNFDHIFLGRDAWVDDGDGNRLKGEIVSVELQKGELIIGVVFYDEPLRGMYHTYNAEHILFLNPEKPEIKKYARVIINTWPDGKLISTIKIIRAYTGMGLKEAKDLLDETKIHSVGISMVYQLNGEGTYDLVRMSKHIGEKLFDSLIELGVSVQIEETNE